MVQRTAEPPVNRQNFFKKMITLGDKESGMLLSVPDLCRHTIVFGSSGSGKTTRAFNPLLENMLGELGAGAFIIAAKAESLIEMTEIARRAGREFIIIQPGGNVGLDLLTGSPDVDAMYFRDVFGRVGEEAKRWIDAAVARTKNVLFLLKSAGSQYYTFEHLTSYIFDDEFAAHIRIFVTERLRGLAPESEEAWTIREAISYEEKRYAVFSLEARQAIRFAVSQLLEPLRDFQIVHTFTKSESLLSIDSVFSGKVIILHIPRARYERAAQAIYTLAKRRFFTAVEERRSNPQLEQERPVVFAVDEYQLCVSESDVHSLGIVRSAGCMVLATTQGVSSLYSVLSRDFVDAALQNFTQKIFFKTDDDATIRLIARHSRRGGDEGGELETLRAMTRNQALCHVTAADDTIEAVLDMPPLFIVPDYGL